MDAKKYKWNQISKVTTNPGVYAWYLPLKISSKDIQDVSDDVSKLKSEGKEILAKDLLKTFVEQKILNFYNEEPYTATLEGPLKPKYKGHVYHVPTISDSLIERMYECPTRIRSLGEILIKTAPNFASPIYIGMAKNLNSRLQVHKRLIESYASKLSNTIEIQELQEEEKRDHNFAMRVINRKIPETEMFVYVQEVSSEEDIYKDVENLLNRINYPVLGRN